MNEHNKLTEEINVYTININFTRVLHNITTLKNVRLNLLNVNKYVCWFNFKLLCRFVEKIYQLYEL